MGHYQSTTTSHNAYVMSIALRGFSLKKAKQACALHHAHTCLSLYVMIVKPGLIEIISQGWVRNKLNKVFLHKLHIKCIKMSKEKLLMKIMILHHLFFGHCVNSSVIVLDHGFFFVQNNHFWIHIMTSKEMVRSYCLNVNPSSIC